MSPTLNNKIKDKNTRSEYTKDSSKQKQLGPLLNERNVRQTRKIEKNLLDVHSRNQSGSKLIQTSNSPHEIAFYSCLVGGGESEPIKTQRLLHANAPYLSREQE